MVKKPEKFEGDNANGDIFSGSLPELPRETAPPEPTSDAGVTVEGAAEIVKKDSIFSPGVIEHGIPTNEQLRDMSRLDDQMTPSQAAVPAGVRGYVPSSPPDIARMPERGRVIKIDRRKLSSRGKATADELPSHEDLQTREGLGDPLTEEEKVIQRANFSEAQRIMLQKPNGQDGDIPPEAA